jgi:hypothetical protein
MTPHPKAWLGEQPIDFDVQSMLFGANFVSGV